MKVVVFTIWHEGNFGAELQTYATIKAIKQLGHDVEVLNLYLSDSRQYSTIGKITEMIYKLSPAYNNFKKFWESYIPVTSRYKSLEEVIANPPQADVYLVGSDQVWNPNITERLSTLFFLPFENQNIRRVAYASSFGINEWNFDPDFTKEIKGLISRFDRIGCRELSGCRILKDVFGIESQNVLDPTLLFENYSELVGNRTDEQDTLAYYPLYKDPQLHNAAAKLSGIMNLRPVNANRQYRILDKITWKRNSIGDWIKSIATAKFVLTPSFHGLAMSLLYKRQFAIVINNNRGGRIKDLLEALDLSERMFSSYEDMFDSKIWEKEIDYNCIDMKLTKMRKESYNFLKSSLRL